MPDGSARSLDNPAVSGFPSRGALSLYATKDVNVYLAKIDGPIVAVASAGRALTVLSRGEQVSEVLLTRPGGWSVEAAKDPSISYPAVGVFVRTADLAMDAEPWEPSREAPATPATQHATVKGIVAPVHSAPDGVAFAWSDCSTVIALVDDRRKPGEEFRAGWVRVQIVDQGPMSYPLGGGRPIPSEAALTLMGFMRASDLERSATCWQGPPRGAPVKGMPK